MADMHSEEFPEYKAADTPDRDILQKPLLSAARKGRGSYDCHGLNEDKDAALADNAKARKQLMAASCLCFCFLICELIGGYLANSLAIMTDAAHLLSDIAGFLISLGSMYLAQKRATSTHTYGYHRAEILGSICSVALIWLITGVIVYEAYKRLQHPQPVNGKLMFCVATGGLIVNFCMGMVLMQSGHGHSHGIGHEHSHGSSHDSHSDDDEDDETEIGTPSFPSRGGVLSPPLRAARHPHEKHEHGGHGHEHGGHGHEHGGHGHEHGGHGDEEEGHGHAHGEKKTHKNINVQAAFIHVIGDAVQSAGVMLAAALIWYNPEWRLADPICSFMFAVLVLGTTTRLMYQASHILMEGIPEDIDADKVREDLQNVPGVLEVHDLHIWSISVGKPSLSVHLLADDRAEGVLTKASNVCNRTHQIHHTTIQVETEKGGTGHD